MQCNRWQVRQEFGCYASIDSVLVSLGYSVLHRQALVAQVTLKPKLLLCISITLLLECQHLFEWVSEKHCKVWSEHHKDRSLADHKLRCKDKKKKAVIFWAALSPVPPWLKDVDEKTLFVPSYSPPGVQSHRSPMERVSLFAPSHTVLRYCRWQTGRWSVAKPGSFKV